MCAHFQRILHKTPHQTMLMAFVFTLVNLNSGLTSHVEKQSLSDDTRTYMNRNLIIASPATSSVELQTTLLSTQSQTRLSSSSSSSSTSALSASVSSPGIPASMSTSSILGYQQQALPPPGSITSASSSTYRSYNTAVSPASIVARSSNTQMHFPQTSGSSITSFDSTNVIDDKIQQHQQQQLQSSSNKNRAAHTLVNVAGNAGVGFLDNQLDATDTGSGDSNMFISPMYFGTDNASVITTQIGATAHIPCTVHHIGDGVVSWIRKKDYHLLTVGLTTYSSDERFSATHLKHSEDWTLQIKFVQLRDAGVYECQVSTHPPTSIFLHLNVVEARAEISGPPIRYLTPGSTLRLQCRVVQNTEASEFIFWYHDNRMINYDIDRGINVSTEPDFQSSELTIQRTRREHSGNYTCVASNTQPASVLVHIFKGDNPAAMYHGHVGSSTKSYQTHLHCIMVLLILGYRLLHSNIHMNCNILC